MSVSSGEIISGIELHGKYESMRVLSGGTANATTVNSGSVMHVQSGGTANNATVNSYGSMFVHSGGSALSIVENGGYVDVADGADVTFTPNVISGLV